MEKYIVKKCLKCGKIIRILNDSTTNTICCNEEMKELIPNSEDAAKEKHVPEYEIKDDIIYIKVNHVMDADHYIEWISIVSENKEIINYLNPGETAEVCTKYEKNSVIYAYCNKHGLWMKKVD